MAKSEVERIKELENELQEIKKRLDYYDKMALKAGFFSMGFLCFGAALAMGVDKLKDKVINMILP